MSPVCRFCDKKYPTQTDVIKHEESEHISEMFRCIACTNMISLFTNYQDIREHSVKEHHVHVDIAAQSSMYLPLTLVKFRCVPCNNDEKQFLFEDVAKEHLKEHSLWFAKNHQRYLEIVCRVCNQSLDKNDQDSVDSHFAMFHPKDNFASDDDIKELLKMKKEIDEGNSARSKWDSSMDSDQSVDDGDEAKDNRDINHNPSNEVKIKNEIEVAIVEYLDEEIDIQKNGGTTEETNENKIFEGLSKQQEATVEIATTSGADVGDKEPNQAEIDHEDTHESDNEEVNIRMEASNNILVTVQNQISIEEKYAGALIPLPCVPFSRKAFKYYCTICPKSNDFNSLIVFEKHRESDRHRLEYGKCFRENKYQHFPDGIQFIKLEPTCPWCNDKFSKFQDLFLHLRTHRFPERESHQSSGIYCGLCKMSIYSADHFHKHGLHIANRMTVPCNFCGMRVFRYDLDRHSGVAHPNEYFRCKIGSCHNNHLNNSFQYSNQILNHQRIIHRVQENLNVDNCQFPSNMVRIQCKLCTFHVLHTDRNQVLDHIQHKHKRSERDLIEYLCRVCNWREDTVPDVEDHALVHIEDRRKFLEEKAKIRTLRTRGNRSYSSSINKFRSGGRSRSRSPLK